MPDLIFQWDVHRKLDALLTAATIVLKKEKIMSAALDALNQAIAGLSAAEQAEESRISAKLADLQAAVDQANAAVADLTAKLGDAVQASDVTAAIANIQTVTTAIGAELAPAPAPAPADTGSGAASAPAQ